MPFISEADIRRVMTTSGAHALASVTSPAPGVQAGAEAAVRDAVERRARAIGEISRFCDVDPRALYLAAIAVDVLRALGDP